MTPEQIKELLESLSSAAQMVYGWALEYTVTSATVSLYTMIAVLVILLVLTVLSVWLDVSLQGDGLSMLVVAVFLVALVVAAFVIPNSITVMNSPEWPSLLRVIQSVR